MYKLSLISLPLLAVSTLARAEVPLERHVEIVFENAGFDDDRTRIHVRLGGEYVPPVTGRRCIDPALFGTLVVTDVQVESQRNPAGGQGLVPGAVGIGAVYPYGVQATLFSAVPTADSLQTHAMHFTSGVVLPHGSELCFRGPDGEFGVRTPYRHAIRSARVIGHLVDTSTGEDDAR